LKKKPQSLYFLITSLLLLFNFLLLEAQEKLAPDIYLIRFTDKAQNRFELSRPEKFFTSRALQRRIKQKIQFVSNDLPVSSVYVDSIKHLGFNVLHESKWTNAVSVNVVDITQFDKLKDIKFVVPYKLKSVLKSNYFQGNKFISETTPVKVDLKSYYGPSYRQIAIHHGDYMHNRGFRGQGMLIAVIDAGFSNAQNMSSLDSLWHENRVKLVRDLIVPDGNVFVQHPHGSEVLSILAGLSPGKLVGSAPKADYVLLRTEDATLEPNGVGGTREREYPVEEFNWAVAAELADSIGVDVISTSLGYSLFNDPQLSHTYSDMNGRTTLISKAAAIASSKGMIVIVSAGNEGNNSWKYITAPADADSILTVGAIDTSKNVAAFSSRGPTSDHRIKPDVVAVGSSTNLQQPDNEFVQGSGTSFSAPIIAGLTACLWQSCPNKTNMEVIRAIKQYASQFSNPDTIKGFGLPDFHQSFYALNPDLFEYKDRLICSPNPFSNVIELQFEKIQEGKAQLLVFDISGRKVFDKQYQVNSEIPNIISISDLFYLARGFYVIQIKSISKTLKTTVLKIE